MSSKAIREYKKVDLKSGLDSASPHRMIQMLLEGVLQRIATAKGHMQRNETAAQGEQISKAITIIGGLQASLNGEKGGEVAGNLDALYDFAANTLMQANSTRSTEKLDEVMRVMLEIKSGWDAIPDEHHATTAIEANGNP